MALEFEEVQNDRLGGLPPARPFRASRTLLPDRSQEAGSGVAARARRLLHARDGLAQAVILAEVLGPPRALRPWRPRFGSERPRPGIGS